VRCALKPALCPLRSHNEPFQKENACQNDHQVRYSISFLSRVEFWRSTAEQMSLGRTALAPKAQIGARAQPMYGYLRHRNPALNLAVPSILALLPTPDEPPDRHPFKSAASGHN